MLIVGFGGGVVVEGVPPTVRKIDVIELEPEVIAANQATAHLRRRDPLTDPRVNIILNDARGALRLTSHRYDAIVSQPSHPWTAGASHLYTREFMQLAHDHLTPDGVFVQWMNVIFMDESLLRSLTATLLSVFPEVRVYRPDPNTIVFLASEAPLNLEVELARTGLPLRGAPLHYARFGINNTEDLVAALVLDVEGARRLAEGSPLITDDENRIATSSVFEMGLGMNGETSGRMLAGFDPMQRGDSLVYRELRDKISFPYLVRRNGVFSMLDPSLVDRSQRVAQFLNKTGDGEYARAFSYRLRREFPRANQYLRLAIDEYPHDQALKLEFLKPSFGPLANGTAPPESVALVSTLDEMGKFVIEVARHAARGEWAQVADADARLAEVPWTHEWYAEVVELRVNWRIRITQNQKRYGDEALSLIDRTAIMSPTLGLYGLRARAGFAAGRPDIVIESIYNYVKLGNGMVRSGMVEPKTLQKDAVALRTLLDEAAKMPGVNAERLAEVRASVDQIPPP
jgi:hypothetical protein